MSIAQSVNKWLYTLLPQRIQQKIVQNPVRRGDISGNNRVRFALPAGHFAARLFENNLCGGDVVQAKTQFRKHIRSPARDGAKSIRRRAVAPNVADFCKQIGHQCDEPLKRFWHAMTVAEMQNALARIGDGET